MLSIFSGAIVHLFLLGEIAIYLNLLLMNCLFVELFKSSLYILDIRPLLDIWFANISSCSLGRLITLLIVFFEALMFLILMRSILTIFYFITCV